MNVSTDNERHKIHGILQTEFKPQGPRNNDNWLSNIDTDTTLLRWSEQFDLRVCSFAMIDFETNKSDTEFASIDLNQLTQRYFACILNTDISTGRGKHWVCIFANKQVNSVEYFNSTGKPPPPAVIRWMAKQHRESIIATNVTHQRSQTECGVYSLYYIRARLEDVPITYFNQQNIPDNEMYKFRRHLFRI